jgi:catechol 2,3-dioxygenase-like lactoylglutathione lyase family enzyme
MGWFSKLLGSDTMIEGIDHVAIVVSNMDKSIEFYREVLELELHHDGRADGGNKKSFLGTRSRTLIAMLEDQNRGKEASGLVQAVAHVAFRVDDVERAREVLKERGVEFIEEKSDDGGRKKSYHFLDPDGLELEIYGEVGQKAVY